MGFEKFNLQKIKKKNVYILLIIYCFILMWLPLRKESEPESHNAFLWF